MLLLFIIIIVIAIGVTMVIMSASRDHHKMPGRTIEEPRNFPVKNLKGILNVRSLAMCLCVGVCMLVMSMRYVCMCAFL